MLYNQAQTPPQAVLGRCPVARPCRMTAEPHRGFWGRERSPLKPSGWDGGTDKSAPKRPKDVHAWREPLCIQRRKKALVERTSRTARPTRTRPTTHGAGAIAGGTTASRREPKGAEQTFCPATRGTQGWAGGATIEHHATGRRLGAGAAAGVPLGVNPLHSAQKKSPGRADQQHDRRGRDRRRTARGRLQAARPPAAENRRARNKLSAPRPEGRKAGRAGRQLSTTRPGDVWAR